MNIDLPVRRRGKSQFAFESALAMAEQGRKVVVIGLDRSETADRIERAMGHNVFPATLRVVGVNDK